jgi:hypothetical protein
MRKVVIDFSRPRASRVCGQVLLCSAVAMSMAVTGWAVALQQERQGLVVMLEGLQRGGHPQRPLRVASMAIEAPETTQQLQRARDIIGRIAFPWQAFFDLIERSKTPNVSIISLQPDAVAGHVAIAAEAKDLASALNYVERLKAEPQLYSAYMVSHEEREGRGSSGVKFTISARWDANVVAQTRQTPAAAGTALQ